MGGMTSLSGGGLVAAPTDDRSPAMPAVAYLSTMRGAGRVAVESDLRKLARLLGADDWRAVPWGDLRAEHVAALLAQLPGSPATRNRARATLRGIARAAWRMGRMSSEDLARINDVPPVRGLHEPRGRHIEPWELAELMRTCARDPSPAGRRDAAMIALAAATGARRAEICAARLADLTDKGDHCEWRIVSNGDKERTVHVHNGALSALRGWLAVRGDAPGPLFYALGRGARGAHAQRALTTAAAHDMLQTRARQAGLRPLTWHNFRCTVVGILLDADTDIATVAGLLGHANVQTTARCDRRSAEARRAAASKISVPYFGP